MPTIVDEILLQLRQHCERFEFALIAYCFMPDHLHLLVAGGSERSDLCSLVKAFKQATGFSHRRCTGDALWQHGYHERILRDDEHTWTVARYILENPIRAGLAVRLGDYPFAGSDEYDWPALLSTWDRQRRRQS
jgi:putative transposase